MQQITESMNVHQAWFADAKNQTLETLPEFIKGLLENYSHDYGTICHAITAGLLATAKAMNKHPNAGITGFQAGCIMWGFVKEYIYTDNQLGLRIINYDDLLYPQYADKFMPILDSEVYKLLKETAQAKIEEADKELAEYKEKIKKYKTELNAFYEKYPDAKENPEPYKRVVFGTMDEHEAYQEKVKSGFEFMPEEPYCTWATHSPVYAHWCDIVNGHIPFGMKLNK